MRPQKRFSDTDSEHQISVAGVRRGGSYVGESLPRLAFWVMNYLPRIGGVTRIDKKRGIGRIRKRQDLARPDFLVVQSRS